MRKADSATVRRVGAEIAAQHQVLDSKVRAVAAKLEVPLPAQPNADQQGWLSELDRASGAEFDLIYVDRLRADSGMHDFTEFARATDELERRALATNIALGVTGVAVLATGVAWLWGRPSTPPISIAAGNRSVSFAVGF